MTPSKMFQIDLHFHAFHGEGGGGRIDGNVRGDKDGLVVHERNVEST